MWGAWFVFLVVIVDCNKKGDLAAKICKGYKIRIPKIFWNPTLKFLITFNSLQNQIQNFKDTHCYFLTCENW